MPKKKNKKIGLIALCVAASFVLTCTACANSGAAETPSPPPEKTIPAEENPAAPVPEPAPEPAAEPTPVPEAPASDLVMHVLDVGQADSILVQLPNGQTMLIDGGNSGDEGRIMNYMDGIGVTKIDYLVATHPHADHIGGLPPIIDNMDIGKIYMPRVSQNTQIYERLLTAIENNGLQVNTAKAGVSILNTTDLKIDILAPVADSYKDLNDYSAVIKIVFGETSFLLMGDAGAASEGQITSDVSADVLKVGHHGSSTATTKAFLDKVAPEYAAISVGKDNSYGHPNDEVLSRLNDANVKVFRTDLQGTIVFTSDGSAVKEG